MPERTDRMRTRGASGFDPAGWMQEVPKEGRIPNWWKKSKGSTFEIDICFKGGRIP